MSPAFMPSTSTGVVLGCSSSAFATSSWISWRRFWRVSVSLFCLEALASLLTISSASASFSPKNFLAFRSSRSSIDLRFCSISTSSTSRFLRSSSASILALLTCSLSSIIILASSAIFEIMSALFLSSGLMSALALDMTESGRPVLSAISKA